MPKALRLTPHEVSVERALTAPMVVAARLLFGLAVKQGGLVLAPFGFLKPADVWPVFDQTGWPGYDKAETLAMNKVINEQDAYGVSFTRVALQAAGLLRKRAGVLKATKVGKSMLADEAAPRAARRAIPGGVLEDERSRLRPEPVAVLAATSCGSGSVVRLRDRP